jgi:Protein of unknown function (DUF2934)
MNGASLNPGLWSRVKLKRIHRKNWRRAHIARELIAVTAYHLVEERGFESGHDPEDWMAAEASVSADLRPATRTG